MNAVMERAQRSDAWTREDDAILAETILNRVREGGTQLEGFALAAEKLHRTPAAAGFRWNGVIRHHYATELADAKKARKELRTQHVQWYVHQDDKVPRIRYMHTSPVGLRRLMRTTEVAVRHHKQLVGDFAAQGNAQAAEYAQDVVTDFEYMIQLFRRAMGDEA